MPKKVQKTDRDPIKYLLLATAATILIWFIPVAWIVVYPLRLFVTFIHEGGHALAALATFGSVDRLVIYADASGETYTRGGIQLVVASAGYLASVVYGATLLALGSQKDIAKAALTVTAATILALTFFFAADPFSWVTGIFLTIGLIWVAIAANSRAAHLFLSFLAVQCCLNALFDLKTLFIISAATNIRSDAVTMQDLTFIPATIWTAVWIALSLLALIIALRSYLRRS